MRTSQCTSKHTCIIVKEISSSYKQKLNLYSLFSSDFWEAYMWADTKHEMFQYTTYTFSCHNQLNMLGHDENLCINLATAAFMVQISFKIVAASQTRLPFNSALCCLSLLNFKNSIFSSLSESQLSPNSILLSICYINTVVLTYIRHTVPPETIQCCVLLQQ